MCKPDSDYYRERILNSNNQIISEKLSIRECDKEIAFIIFTILSEEIRLSEIWIDPKYRREGFGSKLVQTVQTVAMGVKKNITLTTHYGVVEFWTKLGFEIIDKNESYLNMVWIPKSLLNRMSLVKCDRNV
jgi:N-acetylglutamate synthase-like GNAT family acetyltransferase